MIINNFWTIATIINLIIFIIVYRKSKKEDKIFNSIGGYIIAILCELVICMITYSSVNYSVTENYTVKTDLVALNDYTEMKEKLNGYYFLFLGGIDGEKTDTYNIRYAYKDSNEVIRIQSKDMQISKVGFIEDDSKEMEVVHEHKYHKLTEIGSLLFKEPMTEIDTDFETDYIFHIPKDSIIKDVNIDLK